METYKWNTIEPHNNNEETMEELKFKYEQLMEEEN